MSHQYDNNMRGVLFPNSKPQGENSPTHKGECEINGVQFWVNAWSKTSKNGKKMVSLSFKPKQAQEHRGGSKNPPAQYGGQQRQQPQDDEEVPF